MRDHLTAQEVNGYIHKTLTDAEREAMDHHLAQCPPCRALVDDAQNHQRYIFRALSADLRQARPSDKMHFDTIRPHLSRARKIANFQFYWRQLLTNAGTVALIVVLSALIFYIVRAVPWQTLESDNENAISKPTLFAATWDDSALFEKGLLAGEQRALDQLAEATVYHIELTMADDLQTVSGRQEIRYTNKTGQPLSEIVFRLWPTVDDGELTVADTAVNGRPVTATYDKEGNLHLPVPGALAPQAQVVVQMDFGLDVERSQEGSTERLGLSGRVLNLSYFHPTVAVHESGQWKLPPPAHGMGGLSETSFFLVRLNAPRDLTVIASGVQFEPETGGGSTDGQQQMTFAAGPVTQFHITTVARDAPVYSQTVGQTTINSYAYAESVSNVAQLSLGYAVAALESFNQRFGPYPFPELDLVVTSDSGVAGPDTTYPGLGLLGMGQLGLGQRALESAVAHQVSYQWFGRIAGHHLLQEPWLAHSVSEYATRYYYADVHGAARLASLENEWASTWQANSLAIGLPAYAYSDADYVDTLYGRGPVFLGTVAATMGQDTFDRFLRDYYQRYRWDATTTADFKQTAEAHCDCDLTTLFDQWVFSSPQQ
jgi:hypothetical protein